VAGFPAFAGGYFLSSPLPYAWLITVATCCPYIVLVGCTPIHHWDAPGWWNRDAYVVVVTVGWYVTLRRSLDKTSAQGIAATTCHVAPRYPTASSGRQTIVLFRGSVTYRRHLGICVFINTRPLTTNHTISPDNHYCTHTWRKPLGWLPADIRFLPYWRTCIYSRIVWSGPLFVSGFWRWEWSYDSDERYT